MTCLVFSFFFFFSFFSPSLCRRLQTIAPWNGAETLKLTKVLKRKNRMPLNSFSGS